MYTIEYQFRGKVMKPGNGRRLRYKWDEVRRVEFNSRYHLSGFGDFLVHLLAILLHPDMRLVRVRLW